MAISVAEMYKTSFIEHPNHKKKHLTVWPRPIQSIPNVSPTRTLFEKKNAPLTPLESTELLCSLESPLSRSTDINQEQDPRKMNLATVWNLWTWSAAKLSARRTRAALTPVRRPGISNFHNLDVLIIVQRPPPSLSLPPSVFPWLKNWRGIWKRDRAFLSLTVSPDRYNSLMSNFKLFGSDSL